MTHALTANLCAGYFNTATLADDSLKADALVLTAITFPITSWSEDLLVEESVLLWLECAVVDCLWLLYFAERPITNILSRCKTDS